MIPIFNMFNIQKNEDPLIINKSLLQSYKTMGDIYLVNIKRELTRSLVDYKLFQELQHINNDFFVIVDYLDCEHYTNIKDLQDDRHTLLNDINIFTKHCKNCVPQDIFKEIYENCDRLVLTIHKLITIVTDINK